MTSRPANLTAVYPGSFDPLTHGHLDIIRRALPCFPALTVAIVVNPSKQGFFTLDERQALLRDAIDDPRVRIDTFHGLLIDYARARAPAVIIRGLRATSDFDYEFQMATMNRRLCPDVDTFFMMTGQDYFYLSSSLVKEVARFGGNIGGLVPANVEAAMRAKLLAQPA